MTTPEHTIVALCARSHQISKDKGWVKDGDPRPFHTTIALMHSELSEALEEYRAHRGLKEVYYTVKTKDERGVHTGTCTKEQLPDLQKLDSKYGRGTEFIDAKPEGIPIELADLVIRICQQVGTDGNATLLDLRYGPHRAPDELQTDFEVYVTEQHLNLSLAYFTNATNKSPDVVLDYLGNCVKATFAFCEFHDIDLWAAIDEKEAYNKTRPERHGGKKI